MEKSGGVDAHPHCHHGGGGLWPYVPLGRKHVAREGAEAGYPLNWQLASPAQHTVTCSGVPPALHEASADHTRAGRAERTTECPVQTSIPLAGTLFCTGSEDHDRFWVFKKKQKTVHKKILLAKNI